MAVTTDLHPFDFDFDLSKPGSDDEYGECTCDRGYAEPPLTSEPPMAEDIPLTSEPPLATEPALTSEPTAVAGGVEAGVESMEY